MATKKGKTAPKKAAKTAKAPAKAAKAPAEKKAAKANGAAKKVANGASRSRVDPKSKITLLVDKNPKREGCASHKAFSLYKTGMTVEQFLAKGGTSADISWDTRKKYIKLSAPAA